MTFAVKIQQFKYVVEFFFNRFFNVGTDAPAVAGGVAAEADALGVAGATGSIGRLPNK